MQIQILQENLHHGLSIVGRAVASKITMPVLNNILLQTDKGRLKLQATNLEVGITNWLDCLVEEEGAITVPARLLTDFVADLPPDKISITQDNERHTLHLKCGRHEARIKGIDASEFPVIPSFAGQTVAARIPAEALQSAIAQVAFAAASDDSRPVLTGVLMRFEPERIVMAGTDGFRLAERKLDVSALPDEPPLPMIVPSRALTELSRIIGSGTDAVTIASTPNRNQALFQAEDVEMVARLIDGPFPNYAQIIPDSYQSRMVVDTAGLRKAIKIASYFARGSMNIVKLKMEPGSPDGLTPATLTITANAAESGDNQSQLDTVIEGEGGQIAFNAKYVLEALNAIITPLVALETRTHSSPGVLRPVDGDDYLHVIMPMNLFKLEGSDAQAAGDVAMLPIKIFKPERSPPCALRRRGHFVTHERRKVMMQNMFAAPQEQTGHRVVATVQISDGVYEEVLAGAVSRATAVVAHDYPVSKYGGVKGDMYYWLERGSGQNKSKVRLMHCSKDPRRCEEGQAYPDTTYSYVLVLVRLCGGEKDGHIELRKPYGQISADDLRAFVQKYGAALDQFQLDYLEAQTRRAEETSASGRWFWVSNG